jgi:ubiquinone/menaquinone biosynthesis C-methylase UbiE
VEESVYEALGGLLPPDLLTQCDLSHAEAVLHLGCGSGFWLCELARAYPHLYGIGLVQQEPEQVHAANSRAQQEDLSRLAFLSQDLRDLAPVWFPELRYDLIHLSFLSRYALTLDYALLAKVCVALCRPGGWLCWTETELPITTSPAFERWRTLLCQGLQAVGQRFSVEPQQPMHQVDLSSSAERRELGITPLMGAWLRQAGCGRRAEASEAWRLPHPRIVSQQGAVLDLSAGTALHPAFTREVLQGAEQLRPFLLGTGVISFAEYALLLKQMTAELDWEDFYGSALVLRVWGRVEPQDEGSI